MTFLELRNQNFFGIVGIQSCGAMGSRAWVHAGLLFFQMSHPKLFLAL